MNRPTYWLIYQELHSLCCECENGMVWGFWDHDNLYNAALSATTAAVVAQQEHWNRLRAVELYVEVDLLMAAADT